MLTLIRFAGTDYVTELSFREFVDATCARDFYGPATKLDEDTEAMLHGWNVEKVVPWID